VAGLAAALSAAHETAAMILSYSARKPLRLENVASDPRQRNSAMPDPGAAASTLPYRNSHTAPFIYFDLAPTSGVMAGAVEIELVTRTLIPTNDSTPGAEYLVTGRIRCSPAAAVSLRDAINNALRLLQQAQEPARAAAEPAAAPKLK